MIVSDLVWRKRMPEQEQSFVNKPLILLALSHLTTDLSQGALPILLPFFKNAFGLSYTQIGLIVLAQNFTSSVIQPFFGYMTDDVKFWANTIRPI